MNPQPVSSHMKTVAASFLCGCFGGFANILSSHSLDTVKVRMQLLDMKLLPTFKYMFKQEGISSFYKGITSPLFNVPFIYAIYFGAYEAGKYLQGLDVNKQITIPQAMIAGGVAGTAVCVLMTPVELVKCRLQMQGAGRRIKRNTAYQLTRQIVKTRGMKELYKGNLITLCREIPATAVYFGTYEYAARELRGYYGDREFIPLAAGGLAGLLSWAVSYPQDIVKTNLQCDSELVRKYPNYKHLRDGGIITCAGEIWRKGGVGGFTKGFSACSIKAVLAEGMTFFVYEKAKKYSKY
jgi:solute carrier family 25 carnitine/acylcarnitine transporter 20/29